MEMITAITIMMLKTAINNANTGMTILLSKYDGVNKKTTAFAMPHAPYPYNAYNRC